MAIDYSVYLFFAVFVLLLALLLQVRQGKKVSIAAPPSRIPLPVYPPRFNIPASEIVPGGPMSATLLTTEMIAKIPDGFSESLPVDEQILILYNAETMPKSQLAREYLENLRLTGSWTGQKKKPIRKPSAAKGLPRSERWILDDENYGPDPMPAVMEEYYCPPTHGAAKHKGKNHWAYKLRAKLAAESSTRLHYPDPSTLPEELHATDVYANFRLTDTQKIVRQRRQQESIAARNKKQKLDAARARGIKVVKPPKKKPAQGLRKQSA